MRIETITIKGLLRFVEETTLDLRGLDGMFAVVGENGAGKTTILETAIACCYRVFPTRADKELFDYATAPDAFVEVTFELEGRGRYRARVNLDGPHRKTDAALSRLEADGRATVLTDGKVSSYDAAIAQLLPPLPTLLASVFSAQNRAGSFATLDKRRRKELFASLLGLDAYDAYATRAAGMASTSDGQAERARDRIAILDRDAGPGALEAAEVEYARTREAIEEVDRRREGIATETGEHENRLASLQDAAMVHAQVQTKIGGLEVEERSVSAEHAAALVTTERVQDDATRERARLEATGAEDVERLQRRAADRTGVESERQRIDAQLAKDEAAIETRAAADRAALDQQLTKDLADVDERIANNRKVIDSGQEIRDAVARVEDLAPRIAALQTDEARLRERIAKLLADSKAVADRLIPLRRKDAELERARKDAEILRDVPCKGQGLFAACQFLTAAAVATEDIPALEREAAKLVAAKAEHGEIDAAFAQAQHELSALQQDLAARLVAKASAERVAARKTDLEVAAERIAGHERRREELSAAAAAAREQTSTREAARLVDLVATAGRARVEAEARETARQAELEQQQVQRREQLSNDLVALERRTTASLETWRQRAADLADRVTAITFELAGLRDQAAQTADASRHAAQVSASLKEFRAAWDASTTERTRLEHQLGELARRVQQLRARVQERAELQAAVDRHTTDVSEWQLLAKALGRDGLQTLEIDTAGPTVTAFCNDLLRASFGSRFSVELVTQEAKATKSRVTGDAYKEVFELHVYDAQRPGEERDLTDLSGGEQVLVEESLKSAIALLVNTRNPHPIRTCWRDETTGPLDKVNGPRYVEMLRRVRELGGFTHLLYVTHRDDADRADAQIQVGDGRIEIRRAPFGAAA